MGEIRLVTVVKQKFEYRYMQSLMTFIDILRLTQYQCEKNVE